ncbi:hypothetical protein BH10PSE6_BH10PSE6_12360 [soil metagenome]
MRMRSAAAMLAVIGTSSPAFADAWRATAALEPESPALCRQADLSKVVFDFAEAGSELSGKTTNGHAFLAPVAADGSISTTITVPVDGKNFAVDLTGNAKSRDLQVFNKKYSCRFKLRPMQ